MRCQPKPPDGDQGEQEGALDIACAELAGRTEEPRHRNCDEAERPEDVDVSISLGNAPHDEGDGHHGDDHQRAHADGGTEAWDEDDGGDHACGAY